MRPYVWNPWLTAFRAPERPAVWTGDECFSAAELVRTADRLGVGLRAYGVAEGAVVSTEVLAGPDLFALALAALRYGFGLFPLATGNPLVTRLLVAAGSVLHIGPGHTELADVVAAGHDAPHLAARLAPRAGYLVFSTSGTTGEPTVGRQPWPVRPYRGVAVDERYGAGPDRGPHVLANPAPHLGTLGPALYALQAGSPVVVQRPWSPAGFVDLVDRHRADSAFLSPAQLAQVVEAAVRPQWTPVVLCHGGATCPPAVKRAAIALLGPILHEYYGTSDGVISEISTAEWLRRPGSVGRPLPGVRVHADPSGELVVRRRDGVVTHTGDLGYVEDGYLHVVGRVGVDRPAEVARLEHRVRGVPGVLDVAVVRAGDDWDCHVEVSADAPPTLRAEVSALTGDTPLYVHPAGRLPRTASGKLHLAALATR